VRKDTVLLLAIAILSAGIVAFFAFRTTGRSELLAEAARMRRVYVALSMYEPMADGNLPPTLVEAGPFLQGEEELRSPRDPFRSTLGPYPVDAGLPEGPRTAPFRVSDSYAYAVTDLPPWPVARMDPTLGLLANEWWGEVTPGAPFGATVGGRVLRVTTDGSFVTVVRPGPQALGKPNDLFRRPPERVSP
jgi:hypothetical protein